MPSLDPEIGDGALFFGSKLLGDRPRSGDVIGVVHEDIGMDKPVDHGFIAGHHIVPIEKPVFGDLADNGDLALTEGEVGALIEGEEAHPLIDLFEFIIAGEAKLTQDLV